VVLDEVPDAFGDRLAREVASFLNLYSRPLRFCEDPDRWIAAAGLAVVNGAVLIVEVHGVG
jgi:hypothetical protein